MDNPHIYVEKNKFLNAAALKRKYIIVMNSNKFFLGDFS